ncbi:hypothetical protein BDW59DRAFT_159966 [Aspergillus cavernicola]|uniref:NAD(P)-binding protein n=1 Tax=Aspergillus cavernicola TaxID=176166 RepID=A0ABR4IJQ3_9EURO
MPLSADPQSTARSAVNSSKDPSNYNNLGGSYGKASSGHWSRQPTYGMDTIVTSSAHANGTLTQAKDAAIETALLDTLSDDSIHNCVAQVQELTGGSLDALLNNAGAGYSMPLTDLDIAKARELFDLNVWSVLIRWVGHQQHCCSSVTAGTMPFACAYNASKAAVASLTEALRLELEPFGLRVINLMTGGVRSTFHSNDPNPVLPPTSLYNVAKEIAERAMSGAHAADHMIIPILKTGRVRSLGSLANAIRRTGFGEGNTRP